MDQPVGQLSPQEWMVAPQTKAVIAALTADGAEVRFVGGCVRDAVLHRPIRDIDIATHDPPDQVMRLLQKAGITAIPTGIAHGTVTAVIDHEHFEITTLRTDVETFGRKARVAFTDDWVADAARRDFTINALFATPDGMIYDPFDGLIDLGSGIVRFVGNPGQRIEEDVLRLLRFFRFQAYYGRPPPDPTALAACRALAPRLPELSGERVAGEMLKILAAPDPASILLLMEGYHVLQYIMPEAKQFGRLRVLSWLETRATALPSLHNDPIRRMAAMLVTDEAGAGDVANRLRLSNAQTERLVALASAETLPQPDWDEKTRRHALQELGADRFRDLALLAWADRKSIQAKPDPGETQRWLDLVASADSWRPIPFPLKGRDALDLGLKPGPQIGRALKDVETWWRAEDFRPDRQACLNRLRDHTTTPHHPPT